jgi:hypothetical protein
MRTNYILYVIDILMLAMCYRLTKQIANALVEYETLSLDEVRTVLSGKPLNRPKNEGEVLRSEAEKAGTGAIVEGI